MWLRNVCLQQHRRPIRRPVSAVPLPPVWHAREHPGDPRSRVSGSPWAQTGAAGHGSGADADESEIQPSVHNMLWFTGKMEKSCHKRLTEEQKSNILSAGRSFPFFRPKQSLVIGPPLFCFVLFRLRGRALPPAPSTCRPWLHEAGGGPTRKRGSNCPARVQSR